MKAKIKKVALKLIKIMRKREKDGEMLPILDEIEAILKDI